MGEVYNVIEFGTSKIICLINSHLLKGRNIPGVSCVRYEGMRNGTWVAPGNVTDALAAAVEAAEENCAKQIRNAVVGVPGCFSRVISLHNEISIPRGRVTEEDLKTLMQNVREQAERSEVIIYSGFVYFLDDRGDVYVSPPIGIQTRKLTACISIILADRNFIDFVKEAAADLRIQIDGFIHEAYAQAMHFIPAQVRDRSTLLLDVGYHDTNITVVFADSIMASECIHLGGMHLTSDLSRVLNIDMGLAESLKRTHVFGIAPDPGTKSYARGADGRMVSFDATLVRDILLARVEDMAARIRAQIAACSDVLTRTTPIYLTGAGMAMRGAEPLLEKLLKRKVKGVWKPSEMFSPVYQTALSLLDNERLSIYHLEDEEVLGKKKKK